MAFLEKDESVVTAWAESASGPGWANSPLWVLIKDGNGKLRIDCLQPEHQTKEIVALYRISQEAHLSMVKAANKAIR